MTSFIQAFLKASVSPSRPTKNRGPGAVVVLLEPRLMLTAPHIGPAPDPTFPTSSITIGTETDDTNGVFREGDSSGNPQPVDWTVPMYQFSLSVNTTLHFSFVHTSGGGEIGVASSPNPTTAELEDQIELVKDNGNGQFDSSDHVYFNTFIHGSSSLGATTYSATLTLASGTYFLPVIPVLDPDPVNDGTPIDEGAFYYTLNLNVAEGPYPGTSPASVPGTIQAENYDTGGEGLGYHDSDNINAFGAYRSDGVDIYFSSGSSGDAVGDFNPDEWLNYTVSVPAAGTYPVDLRYATSTTTSAVRLSVDGSDKTGAVSLASTGSPTTFSDKTINLPLTAGTHVIRVTAAGSGSGFNFDYFKVSAAVAATTGSISGTVFNDANANAAKDSGEAGIQNRTVYIDANNNSKLDTGEKSTATNSTGAYSLTGLSAGTYKVREVVPAGYSQTTPANGFGQTVTLSSGQNATNENFGTKQNASTGIITGTVFNDANQDWSQDDGEAGISGVTVYLDANNNGVKDSGETTATTSGTGAFTFSGVPVGTAHVREVTPSGYRHVSGPPDHYDVSVTAGATDSGKTFALTARPLLSGQVFLDTNGNGKLDTGETGLSGWTVYLDLNNNGKFDTNENSKVTDSSGDFSFAGLNTGSYVIRVKPPSGYTQTTPANGFGIHVTIANGQVVDAGIFGEKHN